MEYPQKPERYTDGEWNILKDLAQPDERIPDGQFVGHMRSVLANIIRFAERLQVDVPPVVAYLVNQPDDNLRLMQAQTDSTYLEIQLWCGGMKLDIVERSRTAKC